MALKPSRFEESYRTDWLVDLNQILVFQTIDDLFFPEIETSESSDEEGAKAEKSAPPVETMPVPEITRETRFADLERYSNEQLARSGYFKNFCRCSSCMLDIAAVALNQLRPLYRISPDFNPFSTIQNEYRARVRNAVLEAMPVVDKNPHH